VTSEKIEKQVKDIEHQIEDLKLSLWRFYSALEGIGPEVCGRSWEGHLRKPEGALLDQE
jgi:hypothetical protein